jgi:hypothetical protein
VPSNPRRAPDHFWFHRPTRAAGSGGATGSLCLTLYAIIFIELCFNFMSIFAYLSLMWSVNFPYLTASLSCAILSQANPLEVPATYLGSLGYFLARGPVLPNGCSSEKLMLKGGGSTVCNLVSPVLYPKHVYFDSLTLTSQY